MVVIDKTHLEQMQQATQLQPAEESPKSQLNSEPRRRGRPLGSTTTAKNLRKVLHFRNPKVKESTEQIAPPKPIAPPEPWPSRLRQSQREIIRNRIADIAEYTLADKKRKLAERQRKARRRTMAIEARRLERNRIAAARRIANEQKRLKLDRLMTGQWRPRARKRLQLRMESPIPIELQQQYLQRIEEDQKADIEDYVVTDFPKLSFVTIHGPTVLATQEIELDVVCNLLHSLCKKQHSHHPQEYRRLERFGNLCSSRTSNYILSTVVWHKTQYIIDHTPYGLEEIFIEPDPIKDETEAVT